MPLRNVVNELETRDTDSNSSVNYTLTYDANGNLTDNAQTYEYVYDPFGRLIEVWNQGKTTQIADYMYNGLGHRVGWRYDADASSSIDGGDPTFYFCYDERWRIVATFRGSDSSPKERFVYHAAGLAGTGTSSYIDDVMLRDRDYTTDWDDEAADGTLETRYYYCQNWRHDVSAVVTSGGAMIEWAKYSSYGVPFGMCAGDANSNGLIDVNDYNQINTWIGAPAYDVRGDLDLDGDLDANDLVALGNTGWPTLGRGVLSRPDYSDNRKGYAGYEHASELAGAKWHVRHRVLDSELGRWTRRDPLGYVDGMGLSTYVNSAPLRMTDSEGLAALECVVGNPWEGIGIRRGCPVRSGKLSHAA